MIIYQFSIALFKTYFLILIMIQTFKTKLASLDFILYKNPLLQIKYIKIQ